MTTKKAKQLIKEAGGKWDNFIKWMNGQTIGGTPNKPDWYERDVYGWIRYNFNKNENVFEWD